MLVATSQTRPHRVAVWWCPWLGCGFMFVPFLDWAACNVVAPKSIISYTVRSDGAQELQQHWYYNGGIFAQRGHSVGPVPIIMLFIPGTPLKPTHLPHNLVGSI